MKRFLALVIFVSVFATTGLQAQSSKDGERARLEKEIEILDAQLKRTNLQRSDALSSLGIIRKKVANRQALVRRSDDEISALDIRIETAQKEINALQQRLDTMTVYYRRLVRNAYKNRDARVWYMYLLSSGSVAQAGRRYGYLKTLSSKMNVQARKIKSTQQKIKVRQDELKSLRKAAEKLRDKRALELASLRKDEKTSSGLVSRLNRERTKYQKQLNEKRRQVEALKREVRKALSVKSSKPVDVKLAAEFENNRGKLPWPVTGVVVEGFGQHYHPVYKSVKLPFNNGVTMAVQPGTKAHAVFNGVVKQIIVMPGYSQCVLVQHGSYFTFYCKLRSVSVKTGTKVTTGQVLGEVDTINGETLFHFQLWKDKNPQNPELWLR